MLCLKLGLLTLLTISQFQLKTAAAAAQLTHCMTLTP